MPHPDNGIRGGGGIRVDLSKASVSNGGAHMESDTEVSYDKAGTFFPTVKVFSERKGDRETPYTCIPNLGKMRIVVSE